jgi:hypothetical protein
MNDIRLSASASSLDRAGKCESMYNFFTSLFLSNRLVFLTVYLLPSDKLTQTTVLYLLDSFTLAIYRVFHDFMSLLQEVIS